MGDVGESSVAIVAIEPQCVCLPLVAGPIHAVDQQNVLPAVVVVVEESAAGAECFRKKLAAVSAAVVLKLNARGIRHVD